MSFTLCLNKNDLLLLAGFGMLYQALESKQDGKLIRDNQKLICSVIESLEHNFAPGAIPFKKVACSLIAVERFAKSGSSRSDNAARRSSDGSMPAPQVAGKSTKKQLQALASRFSFGSNSAAKQQLQPPPGRRSTVPNTSLTNLALYNRQGSQASLSSAQSEPLIKRANSDSRPNKPSSMNSIEQPNLDYLPLNNGTSSPDTKSDTSKSTPQALDWERLVGFVDSGQAFNCDGNNNPNYVSPGLLSPYGTSPSTGPNEWSPETWGIHESMSQHPASANSVFSLSEESLTSGEELSSCDYATEYRGIAIPNLSDDFGLDSAFGL